ILTRGRPASAARRMRSAVNPHAHLAAALAYCDDCEREAWAVVAANRVALRAVANALLASLNTRVSGEHLHRLVVVAEDQEDDREPRTPIRCSLFITRRRRMRT